MNTLKKIYIIITDVKIHYCAGASVLKMFEDILGESQFREALINYLLKRYVKGKVYRINMKFAFTSTPLIKSLKDLQISRK